MIAPPDITKHLYETRNVDIYIVKLLYKQMYFQKLQVYGKKKKKLRKQRELENKSNTI